jgi:lipopolysaccharide transport system ATP-binding protein
MTPAISVDNLGKCYRVNHAAKRGGYKTLRESLGHAGQRLVQRLRRRNDPERVEDFWALKDVSFDVQPGEVVGIIGRNGAGKSTLLKILSQITKPTTGEVRIHGRIGSLLEVGTGFHPELTGRENVFLNGSILGMSRKEIARRFDDIVAFAEIEKFLDTPVKRYSSGMYVRLAFAVAAHLEPEILMVDEVLAVGDATFQNRCIAKMAEVSRSGRTVLFVSHNLASIRSLCRNTVILQEGRLLSRGPSDQQVSAYLRSLASSAKNGLDTRTDREGSGLARITSVSFKDGDGHPLTHAFPGHPLKVCVAYRSSLPGAKPTIAFSCYTSEGQKVFHVDNLIRGTVLRRMEAHGEYSCVLPQLPLTPGIYQINAMIMVNGEVADHVAAATSLEVLPGDYFDSNRPTPAYGSIVYVDHDWCR